MEFGFVLPRTGGGVDIHIRAYTHIYMYIHKHTHTCLRWWSELPCCADLYQSRDIKLSWQNGSCTSPTLQSADSHRVREHVCVCARTRLLNKNNVCEEVILAHRRVPLRARIRTALVFFGSALRPLAEPSLSRPVLGCELETARALKRCWIAGAIIVG